MKAGATQNFQVADSASGGGYTNWTLNGNNSDTNRVGCVGGGGSPQDPNMYCDVANSFGLNGEFFFRVHSNNPSFKIGIDGPIFIQASPADNAACEAGTMWTDAGFIYVCTSTNTVKRAALSTF